MSDDQTEEVAVPSSEPQMPESAVSDTSSQSTASIHADIAQTATESPISADTPVPVESQNQGINQLGSDVVEPQKEAQIHDSETVRSEPVPEPISPPPTLIIPTVPTSATAPLSPQAPQPQSPVQQDQTSFIHALLAKANAKLFSNRQKKLEKIIQLAQKKGVVTNESVQDLLHCSDATAARYLTKLVQQGRLSKEDGSHWVKYRFLR